MQTLKYGDQGIYVRYLQLALGRAGYDPGNLDGIFGSRTLDAVTGFQRDNGLKPDGIAGSNTWSALFPYLSGYTLHKAKPGDTFISLAERYATDVRAIETANPEIAPTNIPVGAELTIPLGFSVVPDDVPYSYPLHTILTDGLIARYPFLKESKAGESRMGRPITALQMGRGSGTVFYNASHHANEWITSTLVMTYLERYCAAYGAGEEIGGVPAAQLFDSVTLHLIGLVNPDGVDLVTGALPENGRYYREAKRLSENYPNIPFPDGWKANISGIDLNLGYPAGWEQARQIKFEQGYTKPGPRDYVGGAPLEAPENQAVYLYTRKNDFLLSISYHTQGKVIYYKYLNFDPPRADEIGRALSAASGYPLEETPFASGFAGYKDWFIQNYNRPGYTVEAGEGENPLPLTQFPSIYRDNEGILTLGMALAVK